MALRAIGMLERPCGRTADQRDELPPPHVDHLVGAGAQRRGAVLGV